MSKILNIAVDKLTTSMNFEQFITRVNTFLTFILCGVIGAAIYYYANSLHLIG